MKKMYKYLSILVAISMVTMGCEEDLNVPIEGQIAGNSVPLNSTFIETQVVSAYALLDGFRPGTGNAIASSPSNWTYGGVTSDNAYKGSEPNDAAVITPIEFGNTTSVNGYLDGKWRALYEGIARTNITLLSIAQGRESGDLSEAEANQAEGEMRFLRAHYHFDAKQIWNNIPYVTEDITESTTNVGVDSWSAIEADFQYAVDNLDEDPTRTGGATKTAAQAYLAKTHLFQSDYAAAKPLLDAVINSGKHSLNGRFRDNFDLATENSPEAIFSIQYSVGDGTPQDRNGNWGDILQFHHRGPVSSCCGFYQPSQNLVNAFKTDASGLPLLDTFNATDVTNDESVAASDPFTPYTGQLDPRLDWTVARRGIPFLGYGEFAGVAWVRDPSNGGPYNQIKQVFSAAERDNASSTAAWTPAVNGLNTNIIRYAQVLLWRAEVAVDEGDLAKALSLVNEVRNRAALPDNVVRFDNGVPAANYNVQPYSTFPDAAFALKAVKFETRLELALEGHRYFDLVRWGDAVQVMNAYLDVEKTKRVHLQAAPGFTETSNYFAIPQAIIDLSGGLIEQNPGY